MTDEKKKKKEAKLRKKAGAITADLRSTDAIFADKYENTPTWVKKAEFSLDRYNHLMEFLRTLLGFCTLTLQIIILLKLFNVI
jgi:hypothetical protein